MIDIFKFRDDIISHYQAFSQGFTQISAADIYDYVKKQFEYYKRFCPDPLIQITPNYQTHGSINELVEQGILHPDCAKIFQFNGKSLTLFEHQYQAIKLAQQKKSYVVTSGTGSGKSLTFFIPIINAILQAKSEIQSKNGHGQNHPRVRAIIIYPMNALANSQLEEIKKFLKDYPNITVARYTGQEDQRARKEMQDNLPDIILTNFMMLEQILIRSTDRYLVNNCQDLNFLVLDELHTYRGRQGSDVAMLIRRLRVQMNANNLVCIGTSATMSSSGTPLDKSAVVANFAGRLFGCNFAPEQVINETLMPMTLPVPTEQYEYAQFRKQLYQEVELASKLDEHGNSLLIFDDYSSFQRSAFARWLEQNLSINAKLERATPLTIQTIVVRLMGVLTAPEDASFEQVAAYQQSLEAQEKEQIELQANPLTITCTQALKNFLSMFGQNDYIRTPQGKNPFAFKLHQFISGPTRVFVTLQQPERTITLEGQTCIADPNDSSNILPLFEAFFCRDCGMEYIPVMILEDRIPAKTIQKVIPRTLDANEEDDENMDENCSTGFICPVRDELEYKGEFEKLPDEWKDPKKPHQLKSAKKQAQPVKIMLDEQGNVSNNGHAYWLIRGTFQFCVSCLHTFSTRGKEKHRLLGLSGEGRSAVTTIISLQLIRQLYQYVWDKAIAENRTPSVQDENQCKLLGFVDNRQDAALQAGHFNDFVLRLILRSSMIAALRQSDKPQSIEDLIEQICSILHFSENDIHDQKCLANFMTVPQGENSSVISTRFKQAREVISFIFGMNIIDELRNLGLYTCPSLEELNLLEIHYYGLEEMCQSEAFMSTSPLLGILSCDERLTLFKTLLNQLCDKHCIDSIYFDTFRIKEILSKARNNVLPKWIPQDYLFDKDRYFVLNKASETERTVLGTEQSSIHRMMRNHKVWKDHDLTLDTKEATSLLHDMIDMLDRHGLLQQSELNGPEKNTNVQGYQLRMSVLLLGTAKAQDSTSADNTNLANEELSTVQAYNQLINTNRDAGDAQQNEERFFARLYLDIANMLQTKEHNIGLVHSLLNIEAHEHTAQVSSQDRIELEQRFRANENDLKKWDATHKDIPFKRIPLLFCSPTMELGIDISALNYVFMRNVPPTAANYVQRAGRAGRSGQQALVITYCTAMSPHDQWFFKHPEEMVQGIVNEPTIDLTNDALLRSHLHAIWLAAGCVGMQPFVSQVLDLQTNRYPVLPEIQAILNPKFSGNIRPDANTNQDSEHDGDSSNVDTQNALSIPLQVINTAVGMAQRVIEMVDEPEVQKQWMQGTKLQEFMSQSYHEFDRSFNIWREQLNSIISQLNKINKLLSSPANSEKTSEQLNREHSRLLSQKDLLLSTKMSYGSSEFYVYRYLATQGFLPGYNFAAMPLQAWIFQQENTDSGKKNDKKGAEKRTLISRPRFIGLSEFAPFSLIYHQGHIFMSNRLKISADTFNNATRQLNTIVAHVCEHCGYVTTARVANSCDYCHSQLRPESDIRNLYKISVVETIERKRISILDETRLSQGLEIRTLFSFAPAPNKAQGFIPPVVCELNVDDNFIATLTYAQNAVIKRINLGWRHSSDKTGFLIDPTTGYWKSANKAKPKGKKKAVKIANLDDLHDNEISEKETQNLQKIVPYVEDIHNLLILEPHIEDYDPSFMATLLAALQRAIEQVYQLESGDLFVELSSKETERNLILIYESGEGGSGVLLNLIRNPAAIHKVALRALKIMHYDLPEDSSEWDLDNLEQYDTNPNCYAGCYDCLLSYFNQQSHKDIYRRHTDVLKFLIQMSQCNVTLKEPELQANDLDDNEQSTVETTPLQRFIIWASQQGYPLPDTQDKVFKSLGLSYDAAYKSEQICLCFEERPIDEFDALEEFGWTLLDLSNESEWAEQMSKHFKL